MLNRSDLKIVKNSALFGGLDDRSADRIIGLCQPRLYEANEFLFHCGQSPKEIYLICEGVVQLFRGSDEGKHAVMGIREKGDVAGLTSLISGRHHYSTAKTVEKGKALEIPASAFKEILSHSPGTADRLLRIVADNVLGISRHMERLQLLQTTERLADYLLNTVDGNATSSEVTLPCDKGLIATYLGMERESFSRALAKLRRVGVITKGRRIQINDTSALRELRDQPG